MQIRIMTWQISVEQIKPTPEELLATYNVPISGSEKCDDLGTVRRQRK